MSITHFTDTATKPRVKSSPAGEFDREFLRSHLQRKALHGSFDREFSKAYAPNENGGAATPVMHRFGSSTLPRCEYVALTSKSFRAVLVVDIDQKGTPGGWAESLNPSVSARLNTLMSAGFGPSWIGVNPLSGKGQAIWHIDPVYAAAGRRSSNIELYDQTARELDEYLGGDGHFARHFSRSPFYEGLNPTAYRWHCYDHHVYRLRSLLDTLRALSGKEEPLVETFSGGRARIEAAKNARLSAQKRGLTAPDRYRLDHDTVDGITVYWAEEQPGKALRDFTAFSHALRTGYELKRAGKPLKNDAIIDAYVRAYLTAHEVGDALRPNELPSQRDLTTMARRVRGYVYANKSAEEPRARQSTAGRKALATMGRRGGQKSARRWRTEPEGEYAQAQRENLAAANARRMYSGQALKARVQASILGARAEGAKDPSTKELATEFKVSEARIKQVRKELGLSAKRGRPKKDNAVSG